MVTGRSTCQTAANPAERLRAPCWLLWRLESGWLCGGSPELISCVQTWLKAPRLLLFFELWLQACEECLQNPFSDVVIPQSQRNFVVKTYFLHIFGLLRKSGVLSWTKWTKLSKCSLNIIKNTFTFFLSYILNHQHASGRQTWSKKLKCEMSR